MNRSLMLSRLKEDVEWDIVIIGGGATGLGAAVDAASRGYKTLLVEQADFGKGTSSRSTKLVHGGVRYLAQGNIKLVREALKERGWLLKNAPHVTSVQPFVIPCYSWWRKWFYLTGLRLYDLLSARLSIGSTAALSVKETLDVLPGLRSKGLKGGIRYYDGQFDDARLCIDLANTAALHGAVLVNYCRAQAFIKDKKQKKITGVELALESGGDPITVRTKAVINATGIFTDAVVSMDDPKEEAIVRPSQGVHLVVDADRFPGSHALMIPRTDDGRVLFAVPWLNKVVVGTTDTPLDTIDEEPVALEQEVDYILQHVNRYLETPIQREEIRSIFAGLRPLVRTTEKGSTALLSRDHTIIVANSGLVTITGGKWTTYRKMAQDAIDNAVFISKLDKRLCITENLPIGDPISVTVKKAQMMEADPSLREQLHPDHPYTMADVCYAVREEMALTAEDVLARRTRLLFLDVAAALSSLPKVLSCMQRELQETDAWVQEQTEAFEELAEAYEGRVYGTVERLPAYLAGH